jgi:hypothetical protein
MAALDAAKRAPLLFPPPATGSNLDPGDPSDRLYSMDRASASSWRASVDRLEAESSARLAHRSKSTTTR